MCLWKGSDHLAADIKDNPHFIAGRLEWILELDDQVPDGGMLDRKVCSILVLINVSKGGGNG